MGKMSLLFVGFLIYLFMNMGMSFVWALIVVVIIGIGIVASMIYTETTTYLDLQKDRMQKLQDEHYDEDDLLTVLEYFNVRNEVLTKDMAINYGIDIAKFVKREYPSRYHKKYDSVAMMDVKAYPVWILNMYFVSERKIFTHHLV